MILVLQIGKNVRSDIDMFDLYYFIVAFDLFTLCRNWGMWVEKGDKYLAFL